MKIERATQLLFLLLVCQGGNAAYANLPRGANEASVQVSAQANKITVSGTVVDVNGEPLVGVSVLEKGTSNGTITDIDGNFSLSVSEGSILEISYVGYKSLTVSSKEALGVLVMKEDSELLDEVVVTALGIKRSQKSFELQCTGSEERCTDKGKGCQLCKQPEWKGGWCEHSAQCFGCRWRYPRSDAW